MATLRCVTPTLTAEMLEERRLFTGLCFPFSYLDSLAGASSQANFHKIADKDGGDNKAKPKVEMNSFHLS